MILAVKVLVYGGWEERAVSPESVGAVPKACPLLIGPGAITTTIVILQSTGFKVTIAAVLVNFLIVWIMLRFIDPIYRFLGKTGSVIIAKVMAIFIADIAIGSIVDGIKQSFP